MGVDLAQPASCYLLRQADELPPPGALTLPRGGTASVLVEWVE